MSLRNTRPVASLSEAQILQINTDELTAEEFAPFIARLQELKDNLSGRLTTYQSDYDLKLRGREGPGGQIIPYAKSTVDKAKALLGKAKGTLAALEQRLTDVEQIQSEKHVDTTQQPASPSGISKDQHNNTTEEVPLSKRKDAVLSSEEHGKSTPPGQEQVPNPPGSATGPVVDKPRSISRALSEHEDTSAAPTASKKGGRARRPKANTGVKLKSDWEKKSPSSQERIIKKALKDITHFVATKGDLSKPKSGISSTARRAARLDAACLPELGTTCRALAIHTLTSEDGNTKCLHHCVQRADSEINDIDAVFDDKPIKVTGTPKQCINQDDYPVAVQAYQDFLALADAHAQQAKALYEHALAALQDAGDLGQEVMEDKARTQSKADMVAAITAIEDMKHPKERKGDREIAYEAEDAVRSAMQSLGLGDLDEDGGRKTKAELMAANIDRAGSLNCGCGIDDALLELFIWKRSADHSDDSSGHPDLSFQSTTTGIRETAKWVVMKPRIRLQFAAAFKAYTGLTVDDLYSYNSDWVKQDFAAVMLRSARRLLDRYGGGDGQGGDGAVGVAHKDKGNGSLGDGTGVAQKDKGITAGPVPGTGSNEGAGLNRQTHDM